MEVSREMKRQIRKEYIRYLIPTVIGMITYSLYCLGDVFFVSWGVGSAGLAALNIALPMFTAYSCLAILIGVGASVTINVCKGEGRQDKADKVFTMAIGLILILGIVLTGLSVIFLQDIALLLGASPDILEQVVVYLLPVAYTVLIYMCMGSLIVMVRSDGNPRLVMAAGMTGNVINIILDYFLVIKMEQGIFGAGLATAIGYSISTGLLMLHFIKRQNTIHFTRHFIDLKLGFRMLRNGIGASILELSVGVSIFMINLALMRVSGATSVAIFNVISNIAFIAKGLFGGMAQASQPIISMNYGKGEMGCVKVARGYAMKVAGLSGLVAFMGLSFFAKELIAALVSTDPAIINQGKYAVWIYFSGCAFTGMNTVLMYYFQSIESAMRAISLAFIRGIGLVALLLLILPWWWQETGIWMVMPVAECLTFICFEMIDKFCVQPQLEVGSPVYS